MDGSIILADAINSFEQGDRFVIDSKGIKYIREDIVLHAIVKLVQEKEKP